MPVYEFECSDCGKTFDAIATLKEHDDGLEPECPKCGGVNVSQVFGKFTLLAGSKTDEFDDFGDDAGDDDSGGDDAGLDVGGDSDSDWDE